MCRRGGDVRLGKFREFSGGFQENSLPLKFTENEGFHGEVEFKLEYGLVI